MDNYGVYSENIRVAGRTKDQGELVMKFVTYMGELGARVGVLDDRGVCDVGFEGDMVAFIEAGAPVPSRKAVKNVRLLAPLRPRSLRDFITFEGHLKTSYDRLGLSIPTEWYEVPGYYKGMPDTVIGPEAEIPWPSYSDYVDCELELAAVVGRRGKNIAVENVAYFLSLVTRSGKTFQPAMFSETVYPVEVFGSGTPPGDAGIDVGRRLKQRDLVELEIEGIGVLRNRVGDRP